MYRRFVVETLLVIKSTATNLQAIENRNLWAINTKNECSLEDTELCFKLTLKICFEILFHCFKFSYRFFI